MKNYVMDFFTYVTHPIVVAYEYIMHTIEWCVYTVLNWFIDMTDRILDLLHDIMRVFM